MLYGNEDDAAATKIAEQLEENPSVKSALSYATTIGKPYTAQELADVIAEMGNGMDLEPSLLNILYYDYFAEGEPDPITVQEFIRFLSEDVLENEMFAGYLDQDITENMETQQKFSDVQSLTAPKDIQSLASFFGMDAEQVKQLFLYYYSQNGGVETGTMTLQAFVNFVLNEVASNELYASQFDAAALAQLKALSSFINVKTMTTGASYQTIASLFGLDQETAKFLFVYYYALSDEFRPENMTLPCFRTIGAGLVEKSRFLFLF